MMGISSDSTATLSLSRCLWLSLPALIIGAVLRISLLAAIPEGCYSPDGGSYFEATHYYFNKGKLKFGEKRRWLYPVLLMGVSSFHHIASPVRMVPILQHALGLATIAGVGWVAGNLTRSPRLWVPVATIVTALWPQMLYYEHEIVAETVFLAAFVFTLALAMPLGSLNQRSRLFWFLFAAMIVVAIKPHGRGIWLGCVLSAVLVTRNPLKWRWESWAAILAGVVVIFTSGSSQQGSWLWLNSSLPLVKTEGSKWKEYREALRPLVDEVKDDPGQYAWKQSEYKKRLRKPDPEAVSPVWAELVKDKTKFPKVASDLAKEGIRSHPFDYLRIVVMKIFVASSQRDDARMWFDPPFFWHRQQQWDQNRWDDPPRVSEMKLLYGCDFENYKRMASSNSLRSTWILAPMSWMQRIFIWCMSAYDPQTKDHSIVPGWFGILAIAGLVCCLVPGHFRATSMLWLPAMLYLGTVFGVGDAVPRYVLPVEWLGLVFACVALDRSFSFLQSLCHRRLPAGGQANPAHA